MSVPLRLQAILVICESRYLHAFIRISAGISSILSWRAPSRAIGHPVVYIERAQSCIDTSKSAFAQVGAVLLTGYH